MLPGVDDDVADPRLAQRLSHVFAMTVGYTCTEGLPHQGPSALLGEDEIPLEVLEAPGLASLRLELCGREGAEDDDLPPGPCDRHIEAALASPTIERPEIQRNIAALIGRECDGEEDRVPLVSLNILEVLDEDALVGVQGCRDLLVVEVAQAGLDEIALLSIECDHTQRGG